MINIRTKKTTSVNPKTLIVAVDIGMTMNTGYYRCPNGADTKPFDFFNNGRGFEKFWDRINQAKRMYQTEEVIVGFESTGPYGEPLIHYLRKRSVGLVQVNPMHTKRLKELQGNSPNKTDRKDPKVIADIMALGHALTMVIPEGAAAELRRLTQARERALKIRTAFFNQMHSLLFILFPEFLGVIKDIKTKTAQYLLRHLPLPKDIIACGTELLCQTLWKVSRGQMNGKVADALVASAQTSAGVCEGEESILAEMKHLLDRVQIENRFIAEVEQKMSDYLKQIPYSASILSMKGIGEVTAAGLIGEVGDFRDFKTISQILKLSGLDLYEISSGQHKGKRRISKRGRPLIRKLLFFAAINLVRKGGIMHEVYQGYLQRGMMKMKALIAVVRKLLRILFALVRDGSHYVHGTIKIQPLLKEAA